MNKIFIIIFYNNYNLKIYIIVFRFHLKLKRSDNLARASMFKAYDSDTTCVFGIPEGYKPST